MRSALVFVMLAGCGRAVYPSDRLVIVEIDQKLANHEEVVGTEMTPLGPLIAEGIRGWDSAGVMMRTKEQIGFVTVSDAPILRVVEDSSSPTDSGDPDLWFGYDDGEIHVKIPPRWSGDADSWRGAVAHEVGHAIGLNHLPPDALMSIGGTLPLNSSDLSALAHVRHRD